MPIRSGINVDISVLGDTQIERTILRFGERALEATELWEMIVQVLRQIENIQFLTQGGHGSGGWAPLAESTLAEKQRKGYPEWIERATLALFESLTVAGAEYSIYENFGSWMRYGTSVPYAMYQQTGTVKMPMRKLINLNQAERKGLVKLIQRFIVTGEVVDPQSALGYF